MQITAEQAAALSRLTGDNFNVRALQFLRSKYPERVAELGDAGFTAFVEHGRRRAERHGFVSERNIVQYLLVMIHLGADFDADARSLPAFEPFLDARSSMRPEMRMRVLIDAAAAAEKRAEAQRHAA